MTVFVGSADQDGSNPKTGLLAEPPAQLDAIHPRHFRIEDEGIRFTVTYLLQRFRGAFRHFDAIPCGVEDAVENRPREMVIVNHEYNRFAFVAHQLVCAAPYYLQNT